MLKYLTFFEKNFFLIYKNVKIFDVFLKKKFFLIIKIIKKLAFF